MSSNASFETFSDEPLSESAFSFSASIGWSDMSNFSIYPTADIIGETDFAVVKDAKHRLRRRDACGRASFGGPWLASLKTAILSPNSPLERFPIRWYHLLDMESLGFKELELIEKVDQHFRNML